MTRRTLRCLYILAGLVLAAAGLYLWYDGWLISRRFELAYEEDTPEWMPHLTFRSEKRRVVFNAKRFGWGEWKLHGKFNSWYESGQKCVECYFYQGLMHGRKTYWFDNGLKGNETVYQYGINTGFRLRGGKMARRAVRYIS